MERFGTLTSRIIAHPGPSALALGAIAACGFQPLALWPLTLVAMAALIALVARARSGRQAALIGWLFGVGHFTLGNNWIATAFTYQANMPAWLGWIAVFLLSLYLAIYPLLAALGAWFLARRFGPGSAPGAPLPWTGLLFIPLWIVSEWLRAWVFTGFAWNPLGIVLLGGFDRQGLALVAPWTGTYGLSGLAVALAALLRMALHGLATGTPRARLGWALGGGSAAAAVSAAMLLPASYLPPPRGTVAFTLVQPDVRQEVLDDPRYYETNFLKTARLSLPRRVGEQRVVFWPESGIPDYLRDGYAERHYQQMTYGADPALARARLGQVIGPRALLLTGAVDLVIKDDKAIAARNSITAFDDRGDILAGYAKAHLVPYGEYLALRWLLEPLGATRLVPGALDFWPGPGPRSFDFGRWGKVGMQICYEIVFSGEVVDRRDRPDYIFNPSNDGWFGSWGPPQHLAQARMRAIEEGLPVIRATPNGISAVIAADGRLVGTVPHQKAGAIEVAIPEPLPPTFFSRWGNWLAGLTALLLAGAAIAIRRRHR